MGKIFTEDSYEQALIELFKQMGYEYEYGPDIERDYREPVNKDVLRECLARVNDSDTLVSLPKDVFQQIIDEAVRLVTSINEGTLEQRNETFTDYLQNGVEVPFVENGEQRTEIVYLVDYEHPENNSFILMDKLCALFM